MTIWLKRISTTGITVVMIEGVAWVGLTLFGAPDIGALTRPLRAPPATPAIVLATPTRTEKCSTFDGALYCIDESTGSTPALAKDRCTAYEGHLYCIAEDA